MEEKLLQYGVVGLMACIFAITAVFIYKQFESATKKLEKEKDKQISELLRRLELYEDREYQKIRDTHEVMNDLKKAVEGLTDIAKGFRELVNLLIDRIK